MTNPEEFKTNTFTPSVPIIVHTYHPEDEIWHYMSKLSGYNYVHNLLKDRVKSGFFGLDIDQLTKTKKEHLDQLKMKSKGLKEGKEVSIDIEIHDPLSSSQ